jgi:hypothetical protein
MDLPKIWENQNTFSNRHLLHAIDKKKLIKDIYTAAIAYSYFSIISNNIFIQV